MKIITIILTIILSIPLANNCFAQDFNQSKKILTAYYKSKNNPISFYCHCPITFTSNKKMVPDLAKCGYIPGKMAKRAQRIEWEHIMPASWLGKQLQCWQNGGRKNCAKDPVFNKREGDMHNLVPAVGEVNAVRSNYGYADLGSSNKSFGTCNFVVSTSKPKAVQPAEYTRGFIARAFLYMSERYNIRLSKQDRRLMEFWNNKYKVTTWECRRNLMIKNDQGNDNKFITEKCKAEGIK
jgi:deoxyribonuclease I